MELVVATFIIKLFVRIKVFNKAELPFCVIFFRLKYDMRYLSLRELFEVMISQFYHGRKTEKD